MLPIPMVMKSSHKETSVHYRKNVKTRCQLYSVYLGEVLSPGRTYFSKRVLHLSKVDICFNRRVFLDRSITIQ